MHLNQATIQPDRAEAFRAVAARWLLWLAGVLLRLGQPRRSRRLRRFVRACECYVERVIFLLAVARVPAPRHRRPPLRLGRRGFRLVCSRHRQIYKAARIRLRGGDLRARVDRLREALSAPARYIARFVARLRRGLHGRRLIVAAPPAQACAFTPPNPAALADSS